jgi:hypothetical protein
MSADVAYLDTSAVVKLLVREVETPSLRRHLRRWPRRSSAALTRVELVRTINRAGLGQLLPQARRQLAALHLIRLDDQLLDRAAELEPPGLRSLDAIHLAAAQSLGSDLAALITYDRRMAAAAEALGLPVISPQ